jgi:hypothetical protein
MITKKTTTEIFTKIAFSPVTRYEMKQAYIAGTLSLPVVGRKPSSVILSGRSKENCRMQTTRQTQPKQPFLAHQSVSHLLIALKKKQLFCIHQNITYHLKE